MKKADSDKSSRKKAYITECQTCGHLDLRFEYLLERYGCPICSHLKTDPKINSVAITHPHMIPLFENIYDAYGYSAGSHQKVNFICPDCKTVIRNKVIKNVVNNGLVCPACNDGISTGERFVSILLNELNIPYQIHVTFDWENSKQYDFYLPTFNCIIEVHGMQHYEDGSTFYTLKGKTFEEEHENDKYKKEIALQHIEHYIEIDCFKSDLDYIEDSIKNNKEFNKLIDLSDVDFEKCKKQSLRSMIYVVAELWNKRLTVEQMHENIHYSTSAINYWLNQARALGICDYSAERAHARRGKKVINLDTLDIYESVQACANILDENISHLYGACNHKIRNPRVNVIFLSEYFKKNRIENKDSFFEEHLVYEIKAKDNQQIK